MIISKRRFDFQAPLFWKVIRRGIVLQIESIKRIQK